MTCHTSMDSALVVPVLAVQIADKVGDHGWHPQRQQVVSARCGDLPAAGDPGGDVCCAASHHRVLAVSHYYCGRCPDLAEPAVAGRVRPFEITDPEEGLSRPADLSLRGLAGPGGGPGAQATFGDPSRSPAA